MSTDDDHELLSEVHVWHLDPRQFGTPGPRDKIFTWLSAEERAAYESKRTESARKEYLLTRALCRTTLARYAGVEPQALVFDRNVHGKPGIVGRAKSGGLHFNLTHTDGLIACAVTRIGEIGLDAEETSRAIDRDGISRHFFSDGERTELQRAASQDRDKRFFEFWVLKEAFLKGNGTGLIRSPGTLTIQFTGDGQIVPLESWQFALHRPTSRHVAATAVRSEAPVPVKWRPCAKFD